ncbi:transporter [Mycobacterium intermedium]|uniref:Transporter n=1 Tax=Mycobacterium intermedium TaxID=28445 RepID=A0A1E3S5E0_MYCIE|nr:ketosteroid isomerase family protein [Mycobacterium intermedium]MCV6966058.1 nuclear transport factor 2 family protein [Mycobacterium intermedium]ODQ97294.1 transporter [Mycobacterium intermedium]OPE47030.1 transporter [Mycobacterium intermedium]ORA96422.1 transporter [Mycobacterium intermedium]
MVAPNRADLLAAVERSPQAVGAHDRAGWVGLFTSDGQVEDPVGSRPHVGTDQIGRFFDTFIAPRDITFHRDLDIVSGQTVLRDVELEVSMGSGVTVSIPALLRYDLRDVNGEWKIARMRAYWELPAMMVKFLRCGPRALSPGLQLSKSLLGNQGLSGTAGFVAGFRRAGKRHKKLVEKLIYTAAARDKGTALSTLSPGATITLGEEEVLDISEFVEQLRGARCRKLIGAGPTVAASLATDHGRGLLFADVARSGDQISRVRYFPA